MVTVLMMALPTLLIGLLPTYAQIGIMAPVLLLMLRILQGVALAGEFAGASGLRYRARSGQSRRHRQRIRAWWQLYRFLPWCRVRRAANEQFCPRQRSKAGDGGSHF